MSKQMLIDAVHPEETRVAVVTAGRVDDFDFETTGRKQLRGNIYLAKITRVEPALQAAFVEYGGNRHGFLAFSEIHPDYYQVPKDDREAALREEAERAAAEADEDEDEEDDDESGSVDSGGRRKSRMASSFTRRYKIQEVIRRGQILLVQVVKEERGNKGAALTTYLSLAGRYCVLMPNTPRGGGISRKINNASDRRRLKKIVSELSVPDGMGLIVRTAGAKRTKTEIKRDCDYLLKLWDNVRELTLSSIAPCMVNEEGGLVHRAMRDLYDKEIEEVWVDGEDAYKEAKTLAKLIMPTQAKKVQQWKDPRPLFVEQRVEEQLNSIFSPVVQLKSGGYLVINQTEALVAIDVNSGKSTRERNIEQTALRTNLEAAEEACRQMRLRDLAGLVVIDFIDMDESKNDRAVEKKLKDCLKLDRARVQHGKISQFGLMEISRQRRRAGVLDASSDPCPSCNGTGRIRSLPSAALQLLRAIEARAAGGGLLSMSVEASADVAIYLLNNKRDALSEIEAQLGVAIEIKSSADMQVGDFEVAAEKDPDAKPEGRRRPARKPVSEPDTSDALEVIDAEEEAADAEEEDVEAEASREENEEGGRKRRRRGRRGGRRRRRGGEADGEADIAGAERSDTYEAAAAPDTPVVDPGPPSDKPAKTAVPEDGGAYLDGLSLTPEEILGEAADDLVEPPAAKEAEQDAAPPRKRRSRRRRTSEAKAADETSRDAAVPPSSDDEAPAAPTADADVAAAGAESASPAPDDAAPEAIESTSAVDAPSPSPEPEAAREDPPAAGDDRPATQDVEAEVEVEVDAEAEPDRPKRRGWWSRRKAG